MLILPGTSRYCGRSLEPAAAPILAQGAFHFRAQTLFNRGDGGWDVIVVFERLDVFVEVGRFCGSTT